MHSFELNNGDKLYWNLTAVAYMLIAFAAGCAGAALWLFYDWEWQNAALAATIALIPALISKLFIFDPLAIRFFKNADDRKHLHKKIKLFMTVCSALAALGLYAALNLYFRLDWQDALYYSALGFPLLAFLSYLEGKQLKRLVIQTTNRDELGIAVRRRLFAPTLAAAIAIGIATLWVEWHLHPWLAAAAFGIALAALFIMRIPTSGVIVNLLVGIPPNLEDTVDMNLKSEEGTATKEDAQIQGKIEAVFKSGEPENERFPWCPEPGKDAGGCKLQKKIGEGGMGVVYLAKHKMMSIPVAVKFLSPEIVKKDKEAVLRFRREAVAASRLKHENIVRVYDVGREQGVYYIVMEYVDGTTLQDELSRKKTIPAAKASDYIIQACRGLDYALRNHVVHRDIKPGNLLLNKKGLIKIADFGLAKHLKDDAALTVTGRAIGTPYYMSPEQAANSKTADHRSDIYSLGCTFFHLVTGAVPYDGDSYYQVMKAHEQTPVPDAREKNSDVPKHIAEIITKMMAKDPSARYQTAKAVLKDLK